MMGRLIALIYTMFGRLVRRGGCVTMGSGSDVRWWGLRAARHFARIAIERDSIVRCRIDFDSLRGEVLVADRCFLGAHFWVRGAAGGTIGQHNALAPERRTGKRCRAMSALRIESPAIEFMTH